MELWKWLILIVVIAAVMHHYSPETYNSTFGKLVDWGKGLFNKQSTESTSPTAFDQDKVSADGSIITPKSGTNYGRPYDYFDCVSNNQCDRFSVTSKCNNVTGECYQP